MGILDQVKQLLGGENTEVMPQGLPEDDVILKYTKDLFDKYKYGRINFESNFYRNLLYRHGNQWVKFDETEGKWRKRRLPAWVPTPVTNLFAATGERIASVMSRVEPNWTFVPASGSADDIVSAKNADKVEPVICEENNVEKIREKISKWVTYTGNAFLLSGVEQKDNGSKLFSDVYSPFEVFANLSIEDIDDQEAIIICTRKDKGYLKKTYGFDIKDEDTRELGLVYLESLAYTTQAEDIRHRANEKARGVITKIVVARPNEDFPNGLYAVVAGDTVCEKHELQKTPDGEIVFPVEHFGFDSVPGAFFKSTPMHDIAPKQEQINRLDSMMELITIRMSSPIWLMPEGTIVKNFSGEPGAQIKYHTMGDSKSAPTRVAGENIPNTLFNWRENLKKDIEETANTFEALKGQTPYSGAPNVAIETLIEQGLTRFGPALRGIAESWRRWMKTQMEFFRIYQMERTLVTKGESSEWEIKKFNSADFSGSVNVRIESDSTIPRSQQVKQTKVLGAVNAQLIDITDPMIRLKVLQELNLDDLAGDMDSDVISAVKENELMSQGGMPQVTPFVDNHVVHISKHRIYAMGEEDPYKKSVVIKHITQHDMIKNAEMNPGMMAGPHPSNMSKRDQEAVVPQNKQTAGAMAPGQGEPISGP